MEKAILAIIEERVDLLEECINEGIDPNKLDERGKSLMFIAIIHGNSECLKILLNAGGDVNMCDRHGRSLMRVAIAYYYGDFACVKVLLQQEKLKIVNKIFIKIPVRCFKLVLQQLQLNARDDITGFRVFLWKYLKFLNSNPGDGYPHSHPQVQLLETAARSGCIKHVKYLLGAGCSVTKSVLAQAGDNINMLKILWGHYKKIPNVRFVKEIKISHIEFQKLSFEQKEKFTYLVKVNCFFRMSSTPQLIEYAHEYLHAIPRCPVLAGNFGEIKYFVPHERHCIMLVLFGISRTSFLPENSLRQRCFLYVTFGWMM